MLGFAPLVAFHGRVDTSAPALVAEQLLTVLREALSNVIRHANATEVEVIVAVDDEVRLVVADNGVGLAKASGAGNGLRNMTQRARALGGDLSVTPTRPGTRLEWRAPLPATDDVGPPGDTAAQPAPVPLKPAGQRSADPDRGIR